MWDWIETSAVAIQAVCSFALVWLSAALVALTAILAMVGYAQLRFQREAAKAGRRQLENDVQLLGAIVQALPAPTTSPDEMTKAFTRDAVITWDDFHFDRFRVRRRGAWVSTGSR
jgi:hypothetical protein